MSKKMTIRDLLAMVPGGLIRTDHGNGSAGPVVIGEGHDLDEAALSETVYLVTKDDDPDTWQLAREACEATDGDAPEYVAVSDPNPLPGEYVAIYAG